jgi:hypothetical protein
MKGPPFFFFLSDPVQIQYDYTKLCHDQKAFYQKEGIIKMSS